MCTHLQFLFLSPPPAYLLKCRGSLVLLAAVDDDILGADTALKHAHLGVVPATAEQARRLDAEVGDALAVVVHDAEAVLLQDALVLLFDFLHRGHDQQMTTNVITNAGAIFRPVNGNGSASTKHTNTGRENVKGT